ncbi:hypothetical protein HK097_003577 [Rhizophlyctis rosea]|uniref:Uncharacterized protein n=1 Tax=Rhizophlyctis rosea TaxID=64517 RepID=A0AAD5S271_9FUNG|nr:hypothetical protein HK097_003577 [Rhizophlyctis rosea]
MHDTTIINDEVFRSDHKEIQRVDSNLEMFRFAEVKPLTKDQLTRLIFESLQSESLLPLHSDRSESPTESDIIAPTRPITREELSRVIQETVQESMTWSRTCSEIDVESVNGYAESVSAISENVMSV